MIKMKRNIDKIDIGTWTVIGFVLGMMFGTALNNVMVGASIGMCLGVLIGSLIKYKRGNKNEK